MPSKIQVVKAYIQTKYRKKWRSRTELESWQEKQLRKHFAFLRRHSPYFKERLKATGYSLHDLRQIPLMDKKVMMEHFDEMNTAGIIREAAMNVALQAERTRDFQPMIGTITVGMSSGTSGNRGIFLVSEEERSEWAGTILAKLLPGGLLHKERIAFFLRANSNLYESVGSKQISFDFFDLMEELDQHIIRLNNIQPTIIVAPSSMLRMLADAKKNGELHISPAKVISVAEVLDPNDKKYIEATFDQTVDQVYQATEGFLAQTCSHGTLHLNEDIVIIEKDFIYESKSRFSPIITDFRRKTQPIIRYQLNDILTLKKSPCPCGSVMTALEQIEGRCDDLFYFPREGKLVQVFPDYIRRAVITASEEIEQYRVIQHSPEKVEVQLLTNEQEAVQGLVKQSMAEYLLKQKLEVPEIIFGPYQPQDRLQKLKRVEQRMGR
ncbi:adenylate cyclase [Gracilibacillus oryzae]|uniref:Adenylate cyclase n=1 Tax=Gracilibacillus oryzae TaxID=1672701 RepID=A0A7C8KTP8_9BACI|nr:F390 synthetase-related protein [Gracilibacillus oryzae]KAB8129185.1 adenylate cyclase [Gracilibacillus oryzae]